MKKQVLLFAAIFLATILLLTFVLPKSFVDAVSGASKSFPMNGNSLYHQNDSKKLKEGSIEIAGEVENPGKVKKFKYFSREVFVKEAKIDSKGNVDFIGAFRYRGYSLFDILHSFNLKKKNSEQFYPIIDAYVKVENDKGESVVFSWSEIFHTIKPHQIIVAVEVAPILPRKKEVEYQTGETFKLVAANDLFSFRNLDNPSKITVYSFDQKDYPVTRNMDPMYSPEVVINIGDEFSHTIGLLEKNSKLGFYSTVFFGMGMGHHPNDGFRGVFLNELLDGFMETTDGDWIRNGLVCAAAVDGYRAIFSFSELFNRADQVFPMLAVSPDENGGYYRIFVPSDFFADRSVKSLMELYFFQK